MFDYVLNCVDGDAGILPAVRTASTANLRLYAPAFRRQYEGLNIVSGWDPLWALECVAAREQFVDGQGDPSIKYHFVNRLSAPDILSIWQKIKALQATELFALDTTLLSNRILTNYLAGSSLNRYFPGSVQTASYDPGLNPTTESAMSGLASGSPLSLSRWRSGIWPRLKAMNRVFPSRAHVTIGSPSTTYDEINRVEEVTRVGSSELTFGQGVIYNHRARVMAAPTISTTYAITDYWKAKGTIQFGRYTRDDQICRITYPYGENARHGSDGAWAIFRVYRKRTDLTTYAKTETTKYVFMSIPDDSEHDAGEYALLAGWGDLVPAVLSIAGESDDVALPPWEDVVDRGSVIYNRGGIENQLLVAVVDYFPLSTFGHTEVDY